jgi:tRNA(Glu) U13 pseudouridine synthase TruD
VSVEPDATTLRLRFGLPSGSYATVVIDRLLLPDGAA